MVSIDDIRKAREQQRARQAELKGLEVRLSWGEAERAPIVRGHRTADLRSRTEAERWGTPERAYQTWKERVERFLEIANAYVAKLEEQSSQARKRYDSHFNLYVPRQSYAWILGEWQGAGRVLPLEFHFVDAFFNSRKIFGEHQSEPGRVYFLTRNGQVSFLDNGFGTLSGRAYVGSDVNLEKAIRAILEPLVIVDRIERGLTEGFDMVTAFDDWGEILRKTDAAKYSYYCCYDRQAIKDGEPQTWITKIEGKEDSDTKLVFGKSFDVTMLNPFYREDIEIWFPRYFEFYTRTPQRPEVGRRNSW